VGGRDIQGIVQLEAGNVTIYKVPNIQNGGSRKVTLKRIKSNITGKGPVGVIGIEALVAIRQININIDSLFGVKETMVEAAQHGLCPVVVCVEHEKSGLIKRLEESGIIYDLVDLSHKEIRSKK
jgi:putative transcriptional regulator